MRYVIAYDISHSRRYYRITKLLGGYGYRVQYSVFECELSPAEFKQLWHELNENVEPEEDRLLAAPVCGNDLPNVIRLGPECPLPGWQHKII